MNELLDAALGYAQLGWPVIPLHGVSEDGRCLCRNNCTGKVIGKKPHIKEWQEKASTDPQTIKSWWQKWPDANVAIVTGGNLLVVDVDPRNKGDVSFAKLEQKYGAVDTALVATGGGGSHYYFLKPSESKIKGGTGLLGAGVDVKSEGGFVVAPPSRHASGEKYQWKRTQLKALPPWLLKELQSIRNRNPDPQALPEHIPEGERHNTLLSYAGRLRQAGLTYDEILARLTEANTRCMPPCSLQEIDEIVRSVMAYRVADYTLDGLGNAHRFRDDHCRTVRRCIDEGSWYLWKGSRWARATNDEIIQLCISTVEKMRLFAPLGGDLEDKLRAWAKACRSEKRVRELLFLSAALEELHTKRDMFDKDPLLLNCNNGTLDLRTLRIKSHQREDYITKKVQVNFNPNAYSERWERFLREACRENQAQIDYLQLAAGYSLTGLTDEEKVFFIVGPGGTGKTTFIEAIRGVMGEYCVTSSPQEFLATTRNSTAPTPGVAKLASVRLVISSEIPHGVRLSEWIVKALTGGDVITARHLYKEEFDFLPQFKLWMTMNEPPRFNYRDSGLKRRIIIIPFEFTPPQPDPSLKRAFRTEPREREAILAWAARGALRWCEGEVLSEPEIIVQATKGYQDAQNPLSLWLEDETVRDPSGWEASHRLRDSFIMWAARKNIKLADFGLVNDRSFSEALRSLGYEKRLGSNEGKRANGWSGLRLRTEEEKF